jgi:hypothetical protein
MAPLTFALLAILAASLASAGPVALDNATLLLNGEQALVLNCQFQNLQQNDPCNSTWCPRVMCLLSSTMLIVGLDSRRNCVHTGRNCNLRWRHVADVAMSIE